MRLDETSENPIIDLLGVLAVSVGYITPDQLQHCLLLQEEQQNTGVFRTLGALLVERELLSEQQLADLLAEQQQRRGLQGPAPARLSERENQLLGLILIHKGLVDESLLEDCREIQREAAGQGVARKMGEILLDEDRVSTERLRAQLDPSDSPRLEFAAEAPAVAAQQQLLQLYFGSPVAGSSEGPAPRYQLRVVSSACHALIGQVHCFDGQRELLLGRAAPSEFQLLDQSISAVHARLHLEDGRLVLHDLNSSNGSYIGNRKVQQARVSPGQLFRVGQTQIIFIDTEQTELGPGTIDAILDEFGIERIAESEATPASG